MASILVLYGSETGNSESIAARIHQELIELGYKSSLHCLSEFRKVGLHTCIYNSWRLLNIYS